MFSTFGSLPTLCLPLSALDTFVFNTKYMWLLVLKLFTIIIIIHYFEELRGIFNIAKLCGTGNMERLRFVSTSVIFEGTASDWFLHCCLSSLTFHAAWDMRFPLAHPSLAFRRFLRPLLEVCGFLLRNRSRNIYNHWNGLGFISRWGVHSTGLYYNIPPAINDFTAKNFWTDYTSQSLRFEHVLVCDNLTITSTKITTKSYQAMNANTPIYS